MNRRVQHLVEEQLVEFGIGVDGSRFAEASSGKRGLPILVRAPWWMVMILTEMGKSRRGAEGKPRALF